jgi:hypothetical protein
LIFQQKAVEEKGAARLPMSIKLEKKITATGNQNNDWSADNVARQGTFDPLQVWDSARASLQRSGVRDFPSRSVLGVTGCTSKLNPVHNRKQRL